MRPVLCLIVTFYSYGCNISNITATFNIVNNSLLYRLGLYSVRCVAGKKGGKKIAIANSLSNVIRFLDMSGWGAYILKFMSPSDIL